MKKRKMNYTGKEEVKLNGPTVNITTWPGTENRNPEPLTPPSGIQRSPIYIGRTQAHNCISPGLYLGPERRWAYRFAVGAIGTKT